MDPFKRLFGLRFTSFLIDGTCIYSLSILLQPVIWHFTFIHFGEILTAIFTIYYTVSYKLFEGRTPAKFLTGLKVKEKNTNDLSLKTIFLRELLLKSGCGLLIPLFVLKELIASWSLLLMAVILAIVLSVTFLFILLFKKTWWELLSGTFTVKENVGKAMARPLLFMLILLGMSAIAVQTFPLSFGKERLMNHFPFKYPATSETARYTSYIKTNGRDPVDYIFDLFKQRDIVVISERLHPEYTQYELISRIVSDKRFANEVGNIFTECGSVSFQDTLSSYLHTSFKTEDELNNSTAMLQRNSNAVWPLWSNTNQFDFLKTVNKLNVQLPDSAKINWYFTGPAVDWQTMTHEKFLQGYNNLLYDSIMAGNIINRYKTLIAGQKRHKALVIMNSRHAYGLPAGKGKKEFARAYYGTTAFLMQDLPQQVANVMINTISLRYGIMMSPIQNGKWDRAFADAGDPDVGFDFAGSPFGADNFDAGFIEPRSIQYADVFRGFIFYKPLEQHISKDGFPYMLHNFEDTIIKRAGYVSQSHAEDIRQWIVSYKQQPVFTAPVKYAILYNIANVIGMPLLLLICLILGLIFYIRLPQK